MLRRLTVNRHCEEQGDEAIQPFAHARKNGLLRFARNDGQTVKGIIWAESVSQCDAFRAALKLRNESGTNRGRIADSIPGSKRSPQHLGWADGGGTRSSLRGLHKPRICGLNSLNSRATRVESEAGKSQPDSMTFVAVLVMPGLDPGIHQPNKPLSKQMDCRVKPGNDRVALSATASSPRAAARLW